MGSDPVTRTIPSGGLGPVAAIEFSPPGSGFDDLVVANYGDGIFALLEGGPDGLNLTPTEPEPGVPNPTDLAFLALDRRPGPVLRRHGRSRGGDTGGPEPGRRDPAAAP